MKLPRRTFLLLAAGAAALPAVSRIARAQAYPSRPVRIIVGFAAGGNFDIVARVIADRMAERLGQPVIVENRPGASSNIATEAAIRAPADGYTLLLGGAVNAINATLYEKLNFNFAADVAPVAGGVQFPNVMTVSASFPARSVPEFIAYAKANPGKINHGSSGIGTSQHLAGELFKTAAGVNFVHIPYRGAAPALTDMLAGQVQVLFEPLPPTMPHIKSGALLALAVTSAARSDALPNTPAIAEFLPGYEASGWNGFCVPKNTPPSVIEILNAAINEALRDPKEGALRRSRSDDAGRIAGGLRKIDRPRNREVGSGAGSLSPNGARKVPVIGPAPLALPRPEPHASRAPLRHECCSARPRLRAK